MMTDDDVSPRRSRRRSSSPALGAAAPPRIALAEDDPTMRAMVAGVLRRDGYTVLEAGDGAELVDLLVEASTERQAPGVDLIIADVRMPRISGLKVLEGLHDTGWAAPTILMTAFGDLETHRLADQLGAAFVFDKPFELDDLRTAVWNITRALQLHDSHHHNRGGQS